MEYVILMSGCGNTQQGIIEKLQNITTNKGYGEKTPLCWDKKNDDVW